MQDLRHLVTKIIAYTSQHLFVRKVAYRFAVRCVSVEISDPATAPEQIRMSPHTDKSSAGVIIHLGKATLAV